jgi:hypothetical protein
MHARTYSHAVPTSHLISAATAAALAAGTTTPADFAFSLTPLVANAAPVARNKLLYCVLSGCYTFTSSLSGAALTAHARVRNQVSSCE